MTATLDLTLRQALDRCLGGGCGPGGVCLRHTKLDRAGLPCQRSMINRKVYKPRTTKGGKPIRMDPPKVLILTSRARCRQSEPSGNHSSADWQSRRASPRIDWEDVICMVKPTAAERSHPHP